MPVLRIAQISDLHYAALNLSPLQLFSKRWLGNLNAALSRKKAFCQERLASLPTLLKQAQVDHLVVTGDLSTTSHPKEFALASHLLSEVEKQGIQVHTLPGNHDNYTKRAFKKKNFYKFFAPSLREEGVALTPLADGWWLITLDTTLATSLISSRGLFSEELEVRLEHTLQRIPEGARVVIANHFPFFPTQGARKALGRGEEIRSLLSAYPQVVFYLHGHTHTHCIADLRGSGFPIVLDCGSTPHKDQGAFHILEIDKGGYKVKVYRWANHGWSITQEVAFHV